MSSIGLTPFGMPDPGQPSGNPRIPGVGPTAGNTALNRVDPSPYTPGRAYFANDDIGVIDEEGKGHVNIAFTCSLGGDNDTHAALDELDPRSPVFAFYLRDKGGDAHGFTQMASLSMMNYRLASRAGRARYGSEATSRLLQKEWPFLGIQQTDTSNRRYGWKQDVALTVHVAKNAEVHNFWLRQGRKLDLGDSLYLLYRRKPYSSRLRALLDDQSGTVRLRVQGVGDDHGDGDGLDVLRPMVPGPPGRGRKRGALAVDRQVVIPDDQQFVWEIVPWSTSSRLPPPEDLWSSKPSDPHPWVGSYIRVGYVAEFYDQQDEPDQWSLLAHQALFPTRHSGAWKEDAHQLPHLIINVALP